MINRTLLLSSLLIALVQSTALTIEPGSIGGQCSNNPTTFANFQAKANSPGVDGIYLLPKSEYDKLAAAANSDTQTSVFFNYYKDFSCVGKNITSCSKSSGSTKLQNEINCVAFVNEGRKSVSADLVVNFGETSGLSTGAIVGIIIGCLVGAVIVGALLMKYVKGRMEGNRATAPVMSNTTGPVPPPASALASNLPPDAHLVEPVENPVAYGNQGFPPATAPAQPYDAGYNVPSSYGPPDAAAYGAPNAGYPPAPMSDVGTYVPPPPSSEVGYLPPGSQVTPVVFQDNMPQYGVPQGQYPPVDPQGQYAPPPPVDAYQGYPPPQSYPPPPQGSAYPPPQPPQPYAPYPPQ